MIYLFIFLLLLFLTIKFEFKKRIKFSNRWYSFVLLLFILVAGLRYKVGGDTLAYFRYYQILPTWKHTSFFDLLNGRYSFFWNLLATTCKSIFKEFALLQVVQSTFVNVTLFWFIKKYTRFRFTALLSYFLIAYLYFNMEIMRESIAISFFLLSYPYFEKKSWFKYYLLVITAFLFHTSAVILLVFPLLGLFKFSKKNVIIISGILIVFIIFLINVPELMNLLLFTETIETKFDAYSEFALNLNGKIFVLFGYFFLPFYLLRIHWKLNHNSDLFQDLYVIYFTIIISYVFFSGFSRFVNYMTPFMIVYFATVTNEIYNNSRVSKDLRRIMVIALFIIVFIPKYIYYSTDTSRFYPNTTKFNLWYPYSSVYSKKEYRYREIIFIEGMRLKTNN